MAVEERGLENFTTLPKLFPCCNALNVREIVLPVKGCLALWSWKVALRSMPNKYVSWRSKWRPNVALQMARTQIYPGVNEPNLGDLANSLIIGTLGSPLTRPWHGKIPPPSQELMQACAALESAISALLPCEVQAHMDYSRHTLFCP